MICHGAPFFVLSRHSVRPRQGTGGCVRKCHDSSWALLSASSPVTPSGRGRGPMDVSGNVIIRHGGPIFRPRPPFRAGHRNPKPQAVIPTGAPDLIRGVVEESRRWRLGSRCRDRVEIPPLASLGRNDGVGFAPGRDGGSGMTVLGCVMKCHDSSCSAAMASPFALPHPGHLARQTGLSIAFFCISASLPEAGRHRCSYNVP